MKQGIFETILGMIILGCAAAFFLFAYKTSGVGKSDDQYQLYAEFDNLEGVQPGIDIKVSGIKIGEVGKIELEPNSYYAVAKFHINNKVKLPRDSRAHVTTSGLIGGKYIELQPGVEDEMFEPGDKVIYTKSAVNIESLINKLVYSFTSGKSKNSSSDQD